MQKDDIEDVMGRGFCFLGKEMVIVLGEAPPEPRADHPSYSFHLLSWWKVINEWFCCKQNHFLAPLLLAGLGRPWSGKGRRTYNFKVVNSPLAKKPS
jgi:hypothetical protein